MRETAHGPAFSRFTYVVHHQALLEWADRVIVMQAGESSSRERLTAWCKCAVHMQGRQTEPVLTPVEEAVLV